MTTKKSDKIYLTKTIFETYDYDRFKALKGQPVDRAENNYKKMLSSIAETGGNYIPVLVNSDLEIIDGNTRFAACKELKLRMIYEVVDNNNIESLELMKHMNETNISWSITDFIEFYATGYKKADFIKLRLFLAKNKFISVNLVSRLSHQWATKTAASNIKKGILPKNIDYVELQTRVDIYHSLFNMIKKESSSKANCASVVNMFCNMGNLDSDRLFTSISKNWNMVLNKSNIKKVASSYQLAELLQKCYNFNLSKKNRVRLFEEEL